MSNHLTAETDRLREELARREAEMTYRQANGENVSALHEQVLTLRQKLAQAQGKQG